MKKEVIIYTKSYCPYCVKAKQLLEIKRVAFQEIDLTHDEIKLSEMLSKANGRKTVPQIFIGDYHVGGCDDLYELNEQNKLDGLLA
jgi:glutaredoxin 3